jgi:hypothetical protein
MNSPIYFVVGQPGACIHYLGCLLKLLHQPELFYDIEKTNDFGKYDGIFGAHVMSEIMKEIGESESNTELIIEKILQRIPNLPAERRILPTHLSYKYSLEQLLERIPEAQIIFVTCRDQDCHQVVINLLVKFYINGLLDPFFFSAFSSLGLMATRTKKRLSILDKEKFININRENHPYLLELYDFVANWHSYRFTLNTKLPFEHNRLHEFKFSELALESTVDRLAQIAGLPSNPEVKEFSSYFKTNQPNFKTIQALIEKVKTSPWADIVYTHAIPKFGEYNTEALRQQLWEECLKMHSNK